MKVGVIGLGEIGSATFEDMALHLSPPDLIGFDVDEVTRAKMEAKFPTYSFRHSIGEEMLLAGPWCDVYIISVWRQQDIVTCLHDVYASNPDALVVIESTVSPSMIESLRHSPMNIAVFPHRFNPNDIAHRIFNLNRVLGAERPEVLERARQFYSRFFENPGMIFQTDIATAVLSKVVENSYRYLEIVLAQELRTGIEGAGYDWQQVRRAANTKFNIDIREARDGVGGKCLPKDVMLLSDFISQYTSLLHMAQGMNLRYQKANE